MQDLHSQPQRRADPGADQGQQVFVSTRAAESKPAGLIILPSPTSTVSLLGVLVPIITSYFFVCALAHL